MSDLLPDWHRVQIPRQQIANVLGFALLQRSCRAPQSFSLFLGQTDRQRGSTHSLEHTLRMTSCKTRRSAFRDWPKDRRFSSFSGLKKEVRAVKLQLVGAKLLPPPVRGELEAQPPVSLLVIAALFTQLDRLLLAEELTE